MSRPGALRRRDRTLDADRRDSANRAAARRELRRIAPPPPPRVGVGECLELGTRAQEEQAAVCGQVRAEPRRGDRGRQAGSTAAGEQAEQAGGWAARLGYGRERARFGLNALYFAFFHIYVWYILCIENFFSKIMGIQLNTIEFMWARPCSQHGLVVGDKNHPVRHL